MLDPFFQKFKCERNPVAGKKAKGDEGMGIIKSLAEKLSVMTHKFYDVAGIGSPLNRLDLVAEHPLMTGQDAVLFVLSENNLIAHAMSK